MYGQQPIDRLDPNNDLALYEKIDLQVAVNAIALVVEWYISLRLETKATFVQLNRETVLIRRLEQSRAERAVHLDGGANNLLGQIVELVTREAHASCRSTTRATTFLA